MSVCLYVCLFVCPKLSYIIEEVIEVDELDEGNISELGCATLGLKLSSATHVRVSYLLNIVQKSLS